MSRQLTIIICTQNRSEIIKDCLQAVTDQSVSPALYDIIVVDNNSSDDTKEVVKKFVKEGCNVRYVFEDKVGLSYARNTGWLNSHTPWITYLDDDAIAHPDFVEKILETCRSYPFDCFGGVYLPWFRYGTSYWLPYNACSNKSVQSYTGELPPNKFASGGNLTIKQALIEEIGGFDTSLGMSGKKISYGEEIDLQIRLRKKGYIVGFNPHIIVDHLVAERKLTYVWWVNFFYAQGRDSIEIWEKRNKNPFLLGLKCMYWFMRAALVVVKKPFLVKGYTFGNFIMEITQCFVYTYGQLRTLAFA